MARDRGLLDDALGPPVRELIDGSAQMYLRDPAGNLVEVDWPEASSLDRGVVGEIALLADERPQSAEALRARLYTS
jgi:lactoylglutathione lyase